MLVLQVKTQGFVQIGNDIRVYVVRVKHNGAVQLGFDAPRDVKIVRGELLPETTQEQGEHNESVA